MSDDVDNIRVIVLHDGTRTEITVRNGTILRDALRNHGFSPYGRLSETLNCGGRGLCATCGVRVRVHDNQQKNTSDTQSPPDVSGLTHPDSGPSPNHWHDRLAVRFGYPRLSCQITINEPLTVQLLPEKLLWGGRKNKSEVTNSIYLSDTDNSH